MPQQKNTVEEVGIGVPLHGGETTLSILKSIRAEIEAIYRLAGRTPPGGGNRGPTQRAPADIKKSEKAEIDSINRVSKAKADAVEADIKLLAQARFKKIQDTRAVNAEVERLEKEHQARLLRIQQETEAKKAQAITTSQARQRAFREQPDIANRDLRKQRKSFKRYRNDPARDNLTNEYRSELADEIKAQRTVQREMDRIQTEEFRRKTQAGIEQARNARRFEKQARIAEFKKDPGLLNRDLSHQTKLFRRARHDPAALDDVTTWEWRREHAAQILAQRELRRENDRAQREAKEIERKAAEEAARAARMAQMGAGGGRPYGPDGKTFKSLEATRKQVERMIASKDIKDFLADPRSKGTAQARMYNQLYGPGTIAGVKLKRAEREAEIEKQTALAIEKRNKQDIANTAKNRAYAQMAEQQQDSHVRSFKTIEADPVRNALRQYGIKNEGNIPTSGGMRGGGPGGGGPPVPPQYRNPYGRGPSDKQAQNPGGFFTSLDAVGRITRNILLYEVISQASYGLMDYVSQSINAAKTTVEFANALRFATEQAGGNLSANLALADSMGAVGLSRQQGRAAVTEAARFTEERPQDTAALTNVVADIAAARGLGINKTDELIEQLRRRESKFYKRIFGKTVESIYQDEARAQIRTSINPVSSPGLFIGLKPNEVKSQREQINAYVANMDDAAKEQAVLNYILQQSSRFQGEAAERANTLAGRLDRLSAAWLNGQEGLGLFITDLKIVNNLLEGLASNAGVLDGLRGPELQRTGPGGTLSDADIDLYAKQKTQGTAYKVKQAIDNLLVEVVTITAALGGLSLLGRRGARTEASRVAYNTAFTDSLSRYGSPSAAAQEARYAAQNARPGPGQQTYTGLQRLTFTSGAGSNVQVPPSFTISQLRGMSPSQLAAAREFETARQTRGERAGQAAATGVAAAAGLAGGAIGYLTASAITSNQLVVTGATLLGGIIGDAAGGAVQGLVSSSVGSAVGAGGLKGLSSVGAGSTAAALAGKVGASSLFGLGALAAGATAIGVPAIIATKIITDTIATNANRELDRETTRAILYGQQLKEQRVAAEIIPDFKNVGQVRERIAKELNTTVADLTKTKTSSAGVGQPVFTRQEFDITQELAGIDKQIESTREKLRATQAVAPGDQKGIKAITDELYKQEAHRAKIVQLMAMEENFRKYGTNNEKVITQKTKDEENRAERQRIQDERNKRDREQRLQEMTNALGKLRDAQQGSFRVVGDVATSLVGQDNPFVQPLAEQITLAERMRQQWGWLGDEAVAYFTRVEQAAINRRLTQLDYGVYERASGLRNRAAQEELARNVAPGISRRERDILDVQTAQIQAAQTVNKLASESNRVLGVSAYQQLLIQDDREAFTKMTPEERRRERLRGQEARQELVAQLSLLSEATGMPFQPRGRVNMLGQSMDAPISPAQAMSMMEMARLSPQAQSMAMENIADAQLDIFSQFDPRDIRNAGLGGVYALSQQTKMKGLRRNIQEAQQKAIYGVQQDELLSQQLIEDARTREAMIKSGGDPKEVGRLSDKLILSRTDGIDPKDLTYDQFANRNDALRREAEREIEDRNEAKKAVAKGLEIQETMMRDIEELRRAIVGGNAKVLIQVQNDTQARIDQEALQNIAEAGQNVPLDQSGLRNNPFGSNKPNRSLGRYK